MRKGGQTQQKATDGSRTSRTYDAASNPRAAGGGVADHASVSDCFGMYTSAFRNAPEFALPPFELASVPDSDSNAFCHQNFPIVSKSSGTESGTQFVANRYKTFYNVERAAVEG